MKNFGIRLKRLRLEKGLTLEQLAKETGLGDYALLLWERNKRAITISDLIKLAQYFNVTTDYLVGL